jgi:DNA-directed RNA polymerase specialized sigma subunit
MCGILEQYLENRSEENLDKVIRRYSCLVGYVIKTRFSEYRKQHYHELLSHGMEGLWNAIVRWERGRGDEISYLIQAIFFRITSGVKRKLGAKKQVKTVNQLENVDIEAQPYVSREELGEHLRHDLNIGEMYDVLLDKFGYELSYQELIVKYPFLQNEHSARYQVSKHLKQLA